MDERSVDRIVTQLVRLADILERIEARLEEVVRAVDRNTTA